MHKLCKQQDATRKALSGRDDCYKQFTANHLQTCHTRQSLHKQNAVCSVPITLQTEVNYIVTER